MHTGYGRENVSMIWYSMCVYAVIFSFIVAEIYAAFGLVLTVRRQTQCTIAVKAR